MSDSWYKVDNVAKVFLATASQRDPRVFRISCTLQEDIDPDTLNTALRATAQEWPQFQVTLHRGLFWHYRCCAYFPHNRLSPEAPTF